MRLDYQLAMVWLGRGPVQRCWVGTLALETIFVYKYKPIFSLFTLYILRSDLPLSPCFLHFLLRFIRPSLALSKSAKTPLVVGFRVRSPKRPPFRTIRAKGITMPPFQWVLCMLHDCMCVFIFVMYFYHMD